MTRTASPTRRKFLTLYPEATRALVRTVTTTDPKLNLVPSPTGSYARASHEGRTVAYVVPGQRGVRVLLDPKLAATLTPAQRKAADLHAVSTGQLVTTIPVVNPSPKHIAAVQAALAASTAAVPSLSEALTA